MCHHVFQLLYRIERTCTLDNFMRDHGPPQVNKTATGKIPASFLVKTSRYVVRPTVPSIVFILSATKGRNVLESTSSILQHPPLLR